MTKLLLLVAVAVFGFKLVMGRWPWEPKVSKRAQAVFRARTLLGVSAAASRDDILAAHKRLVTVVHPDRGGSNAQVHEANAARDLLLDDIPYQVEP
jgi:hypothetical protein